MNARAVGIPSFTSMPKLGCRLHCLSKHSRCFGLVFLPPTTLKRKSEIRNQEGDAKVTTQVYYGETKTVPRFENLMSEFSSEEK